MSETFKDNEHIAAFDEHLKGWADHRLLDRELLRILYMYNVYLVNLMEGQGVEYRGESFKYGVPMCLLVVKGNIAGKPVVAFINGLHRKGCYSTFLRKLELDELNWRVDKYG